MGDTDGRPLRVFLSHTAELRRLPVGGSFIDKVEQAVIAAGHTPVDMKYMTAEPHPPAQVCREAVESADVYLGVLGFRYGSPVREHPEMSYTELEFETAQRSGKPLLVFLLDDTTEGPRELLVDLDHARDQEAFRRRVGEAGITRGKAATPEALANLIERALRKHAEKYHVGEGEPESVPRIWRVPPRNQVFAGRERALDALRASLAKGDGSVSVIQALHGMGGIGKTALAIEHAHRQATDYDLVWWVPSEDTTTIPASLAECARSLRLATVTESVATAVSRLRTYLHDHARWLLCYDNAEDPAALREHLCTGAGHVLITSRNPNWQGIADSVPLDVLDPGETVALLQARAPGLSEYEARRVGDALGNLPLALTQAAVYLDDTGMACGRYLELLAQRAGEVTRRGQVHDYPDSFAASWELTFDQLADHDPAALQMMTISAYLAPEPIPFTLFTTHPELLPEPLDAIAADPLGFTDLTALIRRRALARVDAETLQVHRLVQALLRERDAREQLDETT